MKIKCPQCGEIMHKTIGNHRYAESGLNNVYLEKIPVYKCSCGALLPSFFRLPRLNKSIALSLLEKPALLSGDEIKFLRKNLRLPSKVFANKLGVGKTTLSKWENDVQNHSEGYDRLIRFIFSLEKGIKRQTQLRIQKHLGRFSLKNSNAEYVIIAEKVQDDYIIRYRPVLGSRAEKNSFLNSIKGIEQRSIAGKTNFFGISVTAETGQSSIQQQTLFSGSEASLVSGGIKLHATQTTEIRLLDYL